MFPVRESFPLFVKHFSVQEAIAQAQDLLSQCNLVPIVAILRPKLALDAYTNLWVSQLIGKFYFQPQRYKGYLKPDYMFSYRLLVLDALIRHRASLYGLEDSDRYLGRAGFQLFVLIKMGLNLRKSFSLQAAYRKMTAQIKKAQKLAEDLAAAQLSDPARLNADSIYADYQNIQAPSLKALDDSIIAYFDIVDSLFYMLVDHNVISGNSFQP